MADEKKDKRKPFDLRKTLNRALTDIKIFKLKGSIHENMATTMHFGMFIDKDEWKSCYTRLNELIDQWPEQQETSENRSRLLDWLLQQTEQ